MLSYCKALEIFSLRYMTMEIIMLVIIDLTREEE